MAEIVEQLLSVTPLWSQTVTITLNGNTAEVKAGAGPSTKRSGDVDPAVA